MERTDKEDEIKDEVMNGNITIAEAVKKSKKSRTIEKKEAETEEERKERIEKNRRKLDFDLLRYS